MQISGKNVNNSWIKNVQKLQKMSFTQKIEKSTEVLQIILNKFYTNFYSNSSLLYAGFTPFTHRTTITTTIFNNKEEK